MDMRFIGYDELKPKKGIPGSKVTIWRKERALKFPKRTPFGDRFYGWAEHIIDAYAEALATGHTEEQATAFAERLRKRDRAPKEA
jgi:predicted DNA-binding transcriptional regulator AlpA